VIQEFPESAVIQELQEFPEFLVIQGLRVILELADTLETQVFPEHREPLVIQEYLV
jgi:hypothetical protein